jgi:hypothetical protein
MRPDGEAARRASTARAMAFGARSNGNLDDRI